MKIQKLRCDNDDYAVDDDDDDGGGKVFNMLSLCYIFMRIVWYKRV